MELKDQIISEIKKRYPETDWGFLSEEKDEINIGNIDLQSEWLDLAQRQTISLTPKNIKLNIVRN